MAHFAELDINNVVLRVIVVNNNDCKDQHGNENEVVGVAFCTHLFSGIWKQTSYNSRIRKNYAGIGFIYDEMLDAFIPPKPYASWLLNAATCQWEPPTPCPTDGQRYVWNEITVTWVLKEIP